MKDINKLMEIVSEKYNILLGKNLVGIYLHGSVAFGCFSWDRGDIDFIVVINEPISPQTKLQLMQVLKDLNEQLPPRGFEMSIVLEKYCKAFVCPSPCELHFKSVYTEEYAKELFLLSNDGQADGNFAADFMVIKSVGVVIYGAPIENVFGIVPHEAYLDAICNDIKGAKEDIATFPGSSEYAILNACRVYAYIKDGLVISKEQGGKWGLANLPEKYHSLISAMLNSYTKGTAYSIDVTQQIQFVDYMLELIFNTTK
jgi:streptomycin 3"-adenylyltransferase